MIHIDIPGSELLHIEHLVLDFNGTLQTFCQQLAEKKALILFWVDPLSKNIFVVFYRYCRQLVPGIKIIKTLF